MKIVILHQHFKTPESGGAIRSYYLARALVERGFKTVIITAHNARNYTKTYHEGIEVHSLPIPYDNKFGFLSRSLSFLRYAWRSAVLAGQFRDAKICYAISVPLTVGFAAIWIKKRYNIPFFFEVGDLWPDAPIQLGFVNNYFFRLLLYSMEKTIYRNAEAVVALSSAIQSAIEKKLPGKTVYLVPNMADCDFYRPETKNPELEKKFIVEGKFVVSYIGAMGVANGLDYILECANTCRKANLPIQFLLCGEGALRDRLKASADHLGLNNLTFVDFQDRTGVKDILNITDAVFVCYKNVPVLETGSPNKFFDGLASGKIIVINFGGWIKKEMDENQCGIYVDPRQPTDFVGKIRPFISDKKKLEQFQHAARDLAERKYARKILGEKFSKLFAELAGP